MNFRMMIKTGSLLFCVCLTICLLCCNQKNEAGAPNREISKTVPTVCLYTLGKVSPNISNSL